MTDNTKELLKKLEIAEEKAKQANETYQNSLKKLDKIIELNKKENLKLVEFERIINFTINDSNKCKRLTDIGFDSIKIVEISTPIEDLFDIKLNLDSLFILTLEDFKNLTEPDTIEYNNTINKMANNRYLQYILCII